MTSRFVTKKRVFYLNVALRQFISNVAFVRNDRHATSTAGWRLIIFPCGMPACVTPRETPHSPKGTLVCIRIFVIFSSVFELISSSEHFQTKREVRRHRKVVRNLWSRFELDPSTVARVAGAQSFFYRREWIRRFPGFLCMMSILYVRTRKSLSAFVALS